MRTTIIVLSLCTLATPSRARPSRIETRVLLSPDRVEVNPAPRIEGFDRNLTPGQPALPRRTVEVALHPRAVLSTLKIEVKNAAVDTLPGRRTLPPNPPFQVLVGRGSFLSWGRAGTVKAGRDLAAYGNKIFPRRVVHRERITNRRGLLVLRLRYTPLRYRHSTRELLVDRHTAVRVSYMVSSGRPAEPDPQIPPHLERLRNPGQAKGWYPGAADTATPPGLAIIIPDAISKVSKKLVGFIKQKEALGFKVTVPGDAVLNAIKIKSTEGDAERIRTWLQQNYKKLNLKYVLLIGNPDPRRPGAPMKMAYTMESHIKYSIKNPTDDYYSDLNGDWDLDDDGKVAEWEDDKGTGGIDFTPEVYVGRIPVYDDNVATLDKILDKTMAYIADRGDRTWRRRVLQPAAMLFYKNQYGGISVRMDGATMAKAIYDQVISKYGFSRTTLLEEAGVDPSKLTGDYPLTRDNVVKEWKKGYGLVTWFGHGSPDGVFRTVWTSDKDKDGIMDYNEDSSPAFFTYDDASELDDSRPSFVFHGSCSNGYAERPDNVGYGLLRNGAIGTVSATRVSIISISGGNVSLSSANIFGVERDFTKFILQGLRAGEAISKAKQAVSDQLGQLTWFTRLELVLYGDPTVTLTSCGADADCDDGDACNGKELCWIGECLAGVPVKCQTADPCTANTCDSTSGKCVAAKRPDGEACDDGKFCTVNKVCKAGTCSGAPRCEAKGNPCVQALCDEKARTCDVYPLQAKNKVCREGTDREGTCQAGLCVPDDMGCAALGPPARVPWIGLALALVLLGLRRRRG